MGARFKLAITLLGVVCASACRVVQAEVESDARRDIDAGLDASIPNDSGTPDAGITKDAGPTRPEFDSCDGVSASVPEVIAPDGTSSREYCTATGCSWDCGACSTLSPCPGGWHCERIEPPYCQGVCKRYAAPCPPVDFATADFTIHDPQGQILRADYHHLIDSDAGTVTCVARRIDDDAGISFSGGTLDPRQIAALGTTSCHVSDDFAAISCISDGTVDVTINIDTRPVLEIGYGGPAGEPPEDFFGTSWSIFQRCAAGFRAWDGGHYNYTFDFLDAGQ